jgi:hypothetical protein
VTVLPADPPLPRGCGRSRPDGAVMVQYVAGRGCLSLTKALVMTFEMTWIDTHGPIAAAF